MQTATPRHRPRHTVRAIVGTPCLMAFLAVVFAVVLSPINPTAQAGSYTDTLQIAVPREPRHLSPINERQFLTAELLYQNVYEGLVRYNSRGDIVTSLSRAWSHNKDHTRWSFELQRNVQFHDGAEFTADDVVFTFRNLQVQDVGIWNPIFKDIAFVQRDTKWRVTFILKRPVVDFLHYLARPEAVIVNTFTWRDNATNPEGTGPYTYAIYVRGQRLELQSNSAYWGRSPQIDTVVFHFNKPPKQIAKELKNGTIDGVWGLEDRALLSQIQFPHTQVHASEGAGVLSLIINQGDGPLIHQPLRRAIQHAIDPQAIVQSVYNGMGHPAHGVVKSFGKITLDKPRFAYDPKQAMDILARAGYAQKLTLKLSVLDRPDMRQSARVIVHQLQQVGVVAVVDYIPLPQWHQKININKDYEIALTTILGGATVLNYITPNVYNYKDNSINKLVDSVIASPDSEQKMKSLQEIQRRVVENVTTIPLVELDYISVFRRDIKGIWHTAYKPQFIIDEIRLQ